MQCYRHTKLADIHFLQQIFQHLYYGISAK